MHATVPFRTNTAKTWHVKHMAGRREAGFDLVALQDQLRDAACAAIGGGEVNLRQLKRLPWAKSSNTALRFHGTPSPSSLL